MRMQVRTGLGQDSHRFDFSAGASLDQALIHSF
jgi:hypothetical protein